MIKYSYFLFFFIISCSTPDLYITDLNNKTGLDLQDNIIVLLPYGNSCQSCYESFYDILNSNFFNREAKDGLIIIYSGNDKYERSRLESMLIANSYTIKELDFKDYVKLKILGNNLAHLQIIIIRVQNDRIVDMKSIKAGSTDFILDQINAFFYN